MSRNDPKYCPELLDARIFSLLLVVDGRRRVLVLIFTCQQSRSVAQLSQQRRGCYC